jgi:hypothetical protein
VQPRRRLILALLAALVVAPATARAAIDARVQGGFAMTARVTVAVNVRGEHRGQRLRRKWSVVPQGCQGSVCPTLLLTRQRSDGLRQRVTLRRTGRGRYVGRGAFFVGLRCGRRVYRLGSRAPFRITLTVTSAATVEGVRFARRITATYVNPRRSDSTPCPLGASHDAARYSGRATTPLPAPPSAAFTAQLEPDQRTVLFTDTAQPGAGGAPIIAQQWDFGDPSSGAANTSTALQATHTYSAPGTYQVALTVLDANGLTGTITQAVTIPAAPL